MRRRFDQIDARSWIQEPRGDLPGLIPATTARSAVLSSVIDGATFAATAGNWCKADVNGPVLAGSGQPHFTAIPAVESLAGPGRSDRSISGARNRCGPGQQIWVKRVPGRRPSDQTHRGSRDDSRPEPSFSGFRVSRSGMAALGTSELPRLGDETACGGCEIPRRPTSAPCV